MKITPAIQKEMRRLRKEEGLTYDEIAKRFADQFDSYASQVYYYCRDARDQEMLNRMVDLREGSRDISDLDTYGIGMTHKQIGIEVDMTIQKVGRYLRMVDFDPRYCLHCHARMIPKGKFRLWCNERCHRSWKRTIKLWKEREDG